MVSQATPLATNDPVTQVLGARLGRQLRGYRNIHQLTQGEVAQLVGSITARTVSRYERGDSLPDLPTLQRLVNACDLDTVGLFAPVRRRARGAA